MYTTTAKLWSWRSTILLVFQSSLPHLLLITWIWCIYSSLKCGIHWSSRPGAAKRRECSTWKGGRSVRVRKLWFKVLQQIFLCAQKLLCLVPLPFPHFLPSGETMRIASSEFADDPCSSVKRGTMVRAARALLSAVTRLLILADMADVMRLLAHLKVVSHSVRH